MTNILVAGIASAILCVNPQQGEIGKIEELYANEIMKKIKIPTLELYRANEIPNAIYPIGTPVYVLYPTKTKKGKDIGLLSLGESYDFIRMSKYTAVSYSNGSTNPVTIFIANCGEKLPSTDDFSIIEIKK